VGNGNGSNGYGDEGGGQAIATMAMATAATHLMAFATMWQETKKAMVRATWVIATATRMVGNKEGMGKGSKSNGNRERGQW
jgi:hypothetical protein